MEIPVQNLPGTEKHLFLEMLNLLEERFLSLYQHEAEEQQAVEHMQEGLRVLDQQSDLSDQDKASYSDLKYWSEMSQDIIESCRRDREFLINSIQAFVFPSQDIGADYLIDGEKAK